MSSLHLFSNVIIYICVFKHFLVLNAIAFFIIYPMPFSSCCFFFIKKVTLVFFCALYITCCFTIYHMFFDWKYISTPSSPCFNIYKSVMYFHILHNIYNIYIFLVLNCYLPSDLLFGGLFLLIISFSFVIYIYCVLRITYSVVVAYFPLFAELDSISQVV